MQQVIELAASNNSGTGATAVPFRSRKKTTAGKTVAFTAVTPATSSGCTTTAGEDTVDKIEVDTHHLPDGKPCVACSSPGGDGPIDGAGRVSVG